MNGQEIIEMARQAGMKAATAPSGTVGDYLWGTPHQIEAFAKLVAAAEREACAKLIEPDEEHRCDASWGYLGGDEGVELLDGAAAKIRARS